MFGDHRLIPSPVGDLENALGHKRLTPPFTSARGHGGVPEGIFKIPDRRGDQAVLPEQKQESLTYFFYLNPKEKKWNHFDISFKILQRLGELFIVIVILPTNISQKTLARAKRQKAKKFRSERGSLGDLSLRSPRGDLPDRILRGYTFTDPLEMRISG